MSRFANLTLGGLAALYLLWLNSWLVFGCESFGPAKYNWDQVAAAAITALVAFHASRRSASPYPTFLAIQGVAFLLLAASWVTYSFQSQDHACAVAITATGPLGISDLASDLIYALCVFAMMCSWGYLGIERSRGRPLSPLTTLVFAILMLGLGAIYIGFYYRQYASQLDTMLGRVDAVTAGLEFAVLVAGLFCMLLNELPAVVWMLVGTVIVIAGDMGYTVDVVPPTIEPVWMLGQFVLLAAIIVMPRARVTPSATPLAPHAEPALPGRSNLSGILILISLGAVLLFPVVWLLPDRFLVWQSFFSVLFIVALMVILVWITDRFDDTVSYLRTYMRRVHQSQLVSQDWQSAPPRIRAALRSTGLGSFLDEFRESATLLKKDVLFLGPERLYGPPKSRGGSRRASCFIVMPFSEAWSAEVHRILASACESAGVRPVRGDDLFTPTDIIEDIWQSLNSADFVIADITGRNPNVMYELGMAHTLAKPVLILSKYAGDIPIDLATRRVILYGQSGEDWREDLAQKIALATADIITAYGIAAIKMSVTQGESNARIRLAPSAGSTTLSPDQDPALKGPS